MNFRFDHNNLNVLDLERSVAFYQEALGLREEKRTNAPDGSFSLVFLGDGSTEHKLELTWLRDREQPYNLGYLLRKRCHGPLLYQRPRRLLDGNRPS